MADIGRASLVMYGGMQEEQNIVTFVWNIVMVHLECCGVNSHQDFQLSDSWNEHKEKFQVIILMTKLSQLQYYCTLAVADVVQHLGL